MTPTHLAPVQGELTLDDLESLAFKYGGGVERDLSNDAYYLRGATIAGVPVTLGPVWDVQKKCPPQVECGGRRQNLYQKGTAMQVHEVLTATAAHIRTYGLHKGSAYADPVNLRTSPACFAGAAGVVCEDDAVRMQAYVAVSTYLGQSAVAFSDDPATSAELLCEVLDTVALITATQALPVAVFEVAAK